MPTLPTVSPERSRSNCPDLYDITVYVYDPASGNTGVDRLSLTVADQ
jgi:hypothetical protein